MAPITQNILGLNLVRMPNWYATICAGGSGLCCFFEPCNIVPTDQLMPKAVITDFCDTWDLDASSDIMPEVVPGPSGCWDIDSNGDIMPEPI